MNTLDLLNLPTKATFSGGTIEWIYSASGAKLAKIITVGTGTPTQRDYVNGFEYLTNGETILNRLEHFAMDEGRMRPTTPGGTTYRYEFDLKDHLGNTRMNLTDANNNGVFDNYAAEVLQADDYYPFGMRITRKLSASDNKYTYNGKEHENDFNLNWYHYGARYYDPAIGRWWAVDPADEMNSAYQFAKNDPVKFIDPDGRRVFLSKALANNPEFTKFAFSDIYFNEMVFLFGKGGPLEKYDVYLTNGSDKSGGTTYIFDKKEGFNSNSRQKLSNWGVHTPDGAIDYAFNIIFDPLEWNDNYDPAKGLGVPTVSHEVGGHLFYSILNIIQGKTFKTGGAQEQAIRIVPKQNTPKSSFMFNLFKIFGVEPPKNQSIKQTDTAEQKDYVELTSTGGS